MAKKAPASRRAGKEKKQTDERRGFSSSPVSFLSFVSALDPSRIHYKLTHLWESWSIVLGPELAELARPVGHDKKMLIVACSDPMEAQEIYMRQEEILESVNAFLGENTFTKLFVDQKKGHEGLDRYTPPKKVVADPPKGRVKLTGAHLLTMDPNSPVAKAYAKYVKKADAE
ncbi:MAG: DUF721 domain-containing protein [Desulfovibrionaceae bacterium]|nr:DUF721 domain-containing protein [Desulfovibrionaceae bacterium]